MIVLFLILGNALALGCIIWLYHITQGKERGASNKKLSDALQKLKTQGGKATRQYRDKDK